MTLSLFLGLLLPMLLALILFPTLPLGGWLIEAVTMAIRRPLVRLKKEATGTAVIGSPAGDLNFTSFTPILKELYTPQRIEDLVLGDNRLMRWLTKDKNFSGKKMPIPIHYGSPQGRSHTWATGKANITTSKYTDFYLTAIQDFGFVEIDHFTLKAARNDIGSFLRAKEPEIDNMLKTMGRNASIELYGIGSGSRGQLAIVGTLATTKLTFVNPRSILNFEQGMVLQFASDNPALGTVGAGVRAGSPGFVQITAIDYDAGTCTIDQNLSGAIAAVAAADFVYVDGDYQLAAAGLPAWFPSVTPTAGDNMFGVDRSVNPTRLAGIRYNAAANGDSPLEGIVRLLSKMAVYNKNTGTGLPDAVFCDPTQWTAAELELGPKTVYYDPDDEAVASVGFSAIRINYEGGSVPLFSDIDCATTDVFALNSKSLKLWSMGEFPAIFDDDGNTSLRSTTANALDVQAYAYWQLGCDAPVANGHSSVTAAPSF